MQYIVMRKRPKPRAGADPQYLDWIRQQPCVCPPAADPYKFTRADNVIEAAHVGVRGLGQKCPDAEAIPLCAWHHRTGPLSHHVLGKNFWGRHGIDRDATIAQLRMRYVEETGYAE